MNIKGIFTWLIERIPPPILVGASFMYLVCQKFAQYIYADQVNFGWVDVFGALAVCSYLILIRCLDEHKDFKDDSVNYPDRPVQRGIVTLFQIKIVGAICFFFQLGYSLALDGGWGRVCWLWALSILWLFLMTKEFFVEKWLRQRIMTYLLSHQIITPLIVLWLLQMGSSDQWIGITALWPAIVFVSIGGLIFELTRKTWGPEEEKEGVDSYARTLGIGVAISFILACFFTMTFSLFLIFKTTTGQWINTYSIIFSFTALPSILTYLLFWRKPSIKGRKANEGIFALTSFVAYLLAFIAII